MRALRLLALAAVALAGPAIAAPPASPACGLLTPEETTRLLAGTPMMIDGGPETAGTSSCSWVVQSNGNMLGLQTMKPEAFGGAPDSYYDLMISGVTNGGQKVEPIEGIGTKAVLIGDATAVNLVVMAQIGDKLLNVTSMTVGRDATIEVAKLAAGRM